MSRLVSCLWWTSVVGTAWLTSIFLEALSHISLFHSRSCPDPAHLASVIGPEDELILSGLKSFSRTFCSPLELRNMETLSLGNLWGSDPGHGLIPSLWKKKNCRWRYKARDKGQWYRDSWWNGSPGALVIPLPIQDLGPINSPFCLTTSN